jgi:tryptophan synthase alpha chain
VNRLASRLAWSRAGGRLALVGYLPAGYPDAAEHTACVRAAFEAGVDAMEIALPNPPSPLDGPLIQQAAAQGAAHVRGPQHALELAVRGRVHPDQAVIALAYRTAFEELGAEEFLRVCAAAGVDAVLLPQHTMREQIDLAHRTRAAGLEQVLFIYLEEDLPLLAASGLADPVVYVQSADLQTGGAFDPDKAQERLVELRAALADPGAAVVVGFGLKGRAQVETLVGTSADGVVVGTSMVEAAGDGAEAVRELTAAIQPALPKLALHRG